MKQFVSAVACCLMLIVGLNITQTFAIDDGSAYDLGIGSFSKKSKPVAVLDTIDSEPASNEVVSKLAESVQSVGSSLGDIYDHAATEARFVALEARVSNLESKAPKVVRSSGNTLETLAEENGSSGIECPNCGYQETVSIVRSSPAVQSSQVYVGPITSRSYQPVRSVPVVRSRTVSLSSGNVATMVCNPATGECTPVQSRGGIFGGFFRR